MAEKRMVAEALRGGEELPGRVVGIHQQVLAEGLCKWREVEWTGQRSGMAVELRIDHGGGQLSAPLVQPIEVVTGQPVKIRFGNTW